MKDMKPLDFEIDRRVEWEAEKPGGREAFDTKGDFPLVRGHERKRRESEGPREPIVCIVEFVQCRPQRHDTSDAPAVQRRIRRNDFPSEETRPDLEEQSMTARAHRRVKTKPAMTTAAYEGTDVARGDRPAGMVGRSGSIVHTVTSTW